MVTINGQSVPIGGPDPSGTVMVTPSSTFSLSVEPGVANVLQGESVSFDIELDSSSGFTQLAALSAEGLPSGVTGEFSPSTLTAGQRGTLTLTAASTATIGSVSAAVVATPLAMRGLSPRATPSP